MTNITPEQMRELAFLSTGDYRFRMSEIRAALRTAADQLEAVRRLTELTPSMVHPITREPVDVVYASDLLAALTADTAPQEGRDE